MWAQGTTKHERVRYKTGRVVRVLRAHLPALWRPVHGKVNQEDARGPAQDDDSNDNDKEDNKHQEGVDATNAIQKVLDAVHNQPHCGLHLMTVGVMQGVSVCVAKLGNSKGHNRLTSSVQPSQYAR